MAKEVSSDVLRAYHRVRLNAEVLCAAMDSHIRFISPHIMTEFEALKGALDSLNKAQDG